jgi:hypothetical protein
MQYYWEDEKKTCEGHELYKRWYYDLAFWFCRPTFKKEFPAQYGGHPPYAAHMGSSKKNARVEWGQAIFTARSWARAVNIRLNYVKFAYRKPQ